MTQTRSYIVLALFILLSLGVGTGIGIFTAPGEWYAGLAKPPFNPPNWIFGPVWTVLYILVGIAGWRVWRAGLSRLQSLWWIQMLVNFTWSPAFFAGQRIGLALVIIVALLMLILVFIARAWSRDRISAWLFAPYALWVAFATLLNASILVLN